MNNTFENTDEIWNSCIEGLHVYILSEPAHLCYVSQNLCDTLGRSARELLSDGEDLYAPLVHVSDRTKYLDFLRSLSRAEGKQTLRYRIRKRDGDYICVNDTAVSKYLPDGRLAAFSVLSDVTLLKAENENLQLLNNIVPYGLIKYTCDKQPKITYINDRMLKILRFPEKRDGELDYLEMYKENVYLMIPMEERGNFARYLKRVYTENAPVIGEITVLRCDGTKARLLGWVSKTTDEKGDEQFQSVCMDVTEHYHIRKQGEADRYIKALTEIYDRIFEFDLQNDTVKCLHMENADTFQWLLHVPMRMEDAVEKWIMRAVYPDDRNALRSFFNNFCLNRQNGADSDRPPQIRFRLLSAEGEPQACTGIFLKLDASLSLFCCRTSSEADGSEAQRSEIDSLRSMQEIVMQFTDGLAAFKVSGDRVTPLYASENIYRFFGYSREEWMALMNKSTPLEAFVSRCETSYGDFVRLLERGDAEFVYRDLERNIDRRIKAVCSKKSAFGDTPRYIMLYNIDDGRSGKNAVAIRTFGYFDVFVNGAPIAFRSQKAKELFALLVDRRGGYVSSEEAISFLWEEEPVSPVTQARYRKVAFRLKNILAEYGISDVVESVDGKRRIIPERVRCDLYDYLTGKPEYSQLFKGSYLTNYSWGEMTLGELMNRG